ncbi:uncharacterized protein EV422DRAFT_505388 [Fimicolochytrium jonesii]|uniref:uncharacterized protein n=1 Tax=Fimicolochytrium jonesii TaxID=1396493 RepID=UPI0022FEED40|nr:uncharacterized protein EV422DRAFT_505388 [Fimicolochytrium jonesii]KAI8822584.1 hypothetical protein EV422DRAFT_505388 [Fimicolochytrium jonesii]
MSYAAASLRTGCRMAYLPTLLRPHVRSATSSSRPSKPFPRPGARPPPARVVHKSQKSSQPPADNLGNSFFGNAGPTLVDGKLLIYTGALTDYLNTVRKATMALPALGLIVTPVLMNASLAVQNGIAVETFAPLVGGILAIPFLASTYVSRNYVTHLYQSPLRPTSNPESSPQTLTFQTASIFGKPIHTTVAVTDLRYKPKHIRRTWTTVPDASGKGNSFFVEPKVFRDDPVLERIWTQVVRQTETVEASFGHWHTGVDGDVSDREMKMGAGPTKRG